MERTNLNSKNNYISQVKLARLVSAKMFDCHEYEVVMMQSRNKNIMYARRFFIYYLWKYLNVSHNKMKKELYKIHHATSIHHCNKMENEIELYPDIKKAWITFLYYTDENAYEKLKIDMKYTIEEMNNIVIDKELRELVSTIIN
tara:strand:+ start:756 stop:1187 length:432 start_codon:yes stop_codon:yes gene_type:complete